MLSLAFLPASAPLLLLLVLHALLRSVHCHYDCSNSINMTKKKGQLVCIAVFALVAAIESNDDVAVAHAAADAAGVSLSLSEAIYFLPRYDHR